MLAMYSGVGAGKFPPSNAGNQLACAAMLKLSTPAKTSGALEAGRWNLLTRSCVSGNRLAARLHSAIRQLVTALTSKTNKGSAL
jgi:hypothetical protein